YPGRAVAGADIDEVERGIIGEAVPRGAAAAGLPPFAGPGLGSHFHGGILEAVGRVARHGVPAPELPARLRVIGRDIAPHRHFRTAIADDDLAVEHARGTGDGVAFGVVDGEHGPDRLARLRV